MDYSQKIQLAFKALGENAFEAIDMMKVLNETFVAVKEAQEIEHNNFLKEMHGIDDTKKTSFTYTSLESIIREFENNQETQIINREQKEETISSLKKRIKHCKNHMERKKLQQELNWLYKEKKKHVRA